jgi:hypothetical protein
MFFIPSNGILLFYILPTGRASVCLLELWTVTPGTSMVLSVFCQPVMFLGKVATLAHGVPHFFDI